MCARARRDVRLAVLLLAERRLHQVVAAIEDAPSEDGAASCCVETSVVCMMRIMAVTRRDRATES